MILRSEHIAKSFGKKTVLKDVSFHLNAGSITGIVGENGSGKSVLMQIVVGLRDADKGTVTCEGRLGYCPQQALLFPHLTVKEHFDYFAVAYGITKESSLEQSKQLMEYFNFKKYLNEKIVNLSGGTQQKLNLSIALLHQPDVLILDEPYNGFDWETYNRFWSYSSLLKEQGSAILVVSHFLSDQEKLDHIYNLKNGILE